MDEEEKAIWKVSSFKICKRMKGHLARSRICHSKPVHLMHIHSWFSCSMQAMSGVRSDALLSDEENAVNLGNAGTAADEDDSWDGDGGTLLGKKGDGTLVLPAQVSSNAMFKGVRRKTKQGELEVTVKLSSRYVSDFYTRYVSNSITNVQKM